MRIPSFYRNERKLKWFSSADIGTLDFRRRAMTILIGFLPFLIFAVVSTTHGALAGLLAGAVVSAVLTVKAFGIRMSLEFWMSEH